MVMLPYHTKVLVGGYIRINMGNTGATSFQYDSLFAGWYFASKKDKTVFLKIDLCFITFCMTSPHSQCAVLYHLESLEQNCFCCSTEGRICISFLYFSQSEDPTVTV